MRWSLLFFSVQRPDYALVEIAILNLVLVGKISFLLEDFEEGGSLSCSYLGALVCDRYQLVGRRS